MTTNTEYGAVAALITRKLTDHFAPLHLEVLNESNRHNVPPNSETHFKVVIVSDKFDGLRLLARHRAVNALLADELAGPVHALSIHTYVPQEWQGEAQVPRTPNCRG